MEKGGAFLTTPFGVDEIFTRELWSDDQRVFYDAISDFGKEAVAPRADDIEKLDEQLTRELMQQMVKWAFWAWMYRKSMAVWDLIRPQQHWHWKP